MRRFYANSLARPVQSTFPYALCPNPLPPSSSPSSRYCRYKVAIDYVVSDALSLPPSVKYYCRNVQSHRHVLPLRHHPPSPPSLYEYSLNLYTASWTGQTDRHGATLSSWSTTCRSSCNSHGDTGYRAIFVSQSLLHTYTL